MDHPKCVDSELPWQGEYGDDSVLSSRMTYHLDEVRIQSIYTRAVEEARMFKSQSQTRTGESHTSPRSCA